MVSGTPSDNSLRFPFRRSVLLPVPLEEVVRRWKGTIMNSGKTILITGASQGIGEGLVNTFLERGYNVVAISRQISVGRPFVPSDKLALVEGDVGDAATGRRSAETALERFGSIDALVNNAGIFFSKPFLEYTTDDLGKLSSTNVEGFLLMTQAAVKRMLAQKSGGSVVSISASLADHPIAGVNASVAMITKGGINSATRNLAMEFAREKIRFNAVAPGTVDTSMHDGASTADVETRSPMGTVSKIQEIVDAVVYLTEAPNVTGEVLYVDGGAHVGKW
jgi:NAD(P)-dependent dehydrogenase (short-subunit alcohol dehydrogenase family)